jgi:hypothetical protein
VFKVEWHSYSVTMTENNYTRDTMLVCGNSISPWFVKPDGDMTWNAEDWGRAQSLEIRFHRLGVNESERRALIPAAVLRAKYPGIRFHDELMKRLDELFFH